MSKLPKWLLIAALLFFGVAGFIEHNKKHEQRLANDPEYAAQHRHEQWVEAREREKFKEDFCIGVGCPSIIDWSKFCIGAGCDKR